MKQAQQLAEKKLDIFASQLFCVVLIETPTVFHTQGQIFDSRLEQRVLPFELTQRTSLLLHQEASLLPLANLLFQQY